jgi:DNA-binding GntR family transcriptional regulator
MAAYPKVRTIPELAREIGSKRLTKRAVAALVKDGILEQRETAYVAT